ncbi:hypothetical protein GCM10027590_19620 [Nocardiopsis nanhaiensis]
MGGRGGQARQGRGGEGGEQEGGGAAARASHGSGFPSRGGWTGLPPWGRSGPSGIRGRSVRVLVGFATDFRTPHAAHGSRVSYRLVTIGIVTLGTLVGVTRATLEFRLWV